MIGANSTILPGVKIGDGAIVSAATLVHKDVPAGAMVGGNPMQDYFHCRRNGGEKKKTKYWTKLNGSNSCDILDKWGCFVKCKITFPASLLFFNKRVQKN